MDSQQRKPFVDVVKAAMRQSGVGPTVLSRKVNERLGAGVLNRGKVFRYVSGAQQPSAAIQVAMLEALGLNPAEVDVTSSTRVDVSPLGAGFVRVRVDCFLQPNQLVQANNFLKRMKRLRRKAWGEVLSRRVGEINISGGELARLVASRHPDLTPIAAAMRVSRYMRGQAAPRSRRFVEAICSLLQLNDADLPQVIWEDPRVRRQPSDRGTRVQIHAVLPDDAVDDLLMTVREDLSAVSVVAHAKPLKQPKSRRGVAAMSLEQRTEIARRGGAATPNDKRGFADPLVAREAGRKGGKVSKRKSPRSTAL